MRWSDKLLPLPLVKLQVIAWTPTDRDHWCSHVSLGEMFSNAVTVCTQQQHGLTAQYHV